MLMHCHSGHTAFFLFVHSADIIADCESIETSRSGSNIESVYKDLRDILAVLISPSYKNVYSWYCLYQSNAMHVIASTSI